MVSTTSDDLCKVNETKLL